MNRQKWKLNNHQHRQKWKLNNHQHRQKWKLNNHQHRHKTSPVNFQSWFKLTVQVHNHNTRSQYINIDKLITTNNLFIPTAITSHYGFKLIKVQGPKIWNEIPAIIRSSTSSNNLIKISRN